jgi:Flp pilus assembly protein TadG
MNLRKQKGAALVEFAVILPLLFLLLFGIVEFSLLLYNQQVITNACREGARAGIVSREPRLNSTEITQIVNTYSKAHLVTFGDAISAATNIDNSGGTSFGDDLKVRVTYRYDFLVLPEFINDFVGDIDLAAEAVMKYE